MAGQKSSGLFLDNELAIAVRQNEKEQVKRLLKTGACAGPENVALWIQVVPQTERAIINALVSSLVQGKRMRVSPHSAAGRQILLRSIIKNAVADNVLMIKKLKECLKGNRLKRVKTAALITAAGNNNIHAARVLACWGADLEIKDKNGKGLCEYLKNKPISGFLQALLRAATQPPQAGKREVFVLKKRKNGSIKVWMREILVGDKEVKKYREKQKLNFIK